MMTFTTMTAAAMLTATVSGQSQFISLMEIENVKETLRAIYDDKFSIFEDPGQKMKDFLSHFDEQVIYCPDRVVAESKCRNKAFLEQETCDQWLKKYDSVKYIMPQRDIVKDPGQPLYAKVLIEADAEDGSGCITRIVMEDVLTFDDKNEMVVIYNETVKEVSEHCGGQVVEWWHTPRPTEPSPVWTKKPTPSPVWTKRPTPSPVWTKKPTPSPVWTKRPTPSPVWTAKPTPSPVWTAKPTPSPVWTKKPTPSPVWTKRPTPSPVWTAKPTPSPVWTKRPTQSPSPAWWTKSDDQ